MSDEFAAGSHVEAAAAVVHHHHHPADPNIGMVRAKPGPHAVSAAIGAVAVTLLGVVLLAIALGSR